MSTAARPVHPDSFRLIALIKRHDDNEGNAPDAEGRTAGYDRFALTGAAAHRGTLLLEGFDPLRKTLAPRQVDDVLRLLTAAWLDAFAVGASSRQPEQPS